MIAFIIAECDEDDRGFMTRLYLTYRPVMFSTVKKYISNREEQQDVIQDSLLKLIEKIDLLREKERCILGPYIVYTVRSTAIDHLRHKAVENAHLEPFGDGEEELEASSLPLDELAALKERDVRVAELLEKLTEAERTILVGKYILENSDDELAAQLNCKPSSIRMKLTRARRKALELFINDEVIDHDTV